METQPAKIPGWRAAALRRFGPPICGVIWVEHFERDNSLSLLTHRRREPVRKENEHLRELVTLLCTALVLGAH